MTEKSARSVWLLALLAGCILRIILWSQPVDTSLDRWGSDDMFYYGQVAGHVADGQGATFDGEHLTNGFQPLFLGLLIPTGSWMLHDLEVTTRVIWFWVFLLTVISAVQLRLLGRELNLSIAGFLAGAIVMIHPKILSVTMEGTEGALSFLMLVLTARALIWVCEGRRLQLAALVFSALVLTRLDFAVFGLPIAAFLYYRKVPVRRIMALAIGPAFLLVTWLLLNQYFFGQLTPDSGAAKMIHASAMESQTGAIFLGVISTLFMAEAGPSLLSVLLALLGIWSVWRLPNRLERLGPLWVVLVGGVLSIGLSVYLLGHFRNWYLMAAFLILIWTLALGWQMITSRLPVRSWIPIVLLIFFGGNWYLDADRYPAEKEMRLYLATANEIRQGYPPGTRIGSFNSGVLGCLLGDQYTVVNLDGVVNNSVVKALDQGRLWSYIRSEQLDLIVDHTRSISYFSHFAEANLLDSMTLVSGKDFEHRRVDLAVYELH